MKLLTKPNTCCESRTWITDINTSPPKETPLRSVLNEIMIKFYCSTEDTIIYEFAHAKPLFMSNTEKRRKTKIPHRYIPIRLCLKAKDMI